MDRLDLNLAAPLEAKRRAPISASLRAMRVRGGFEGAQFAEATRKMRALRARLSSERASDSTLGARE